MEMKSYNCSKVSDLKRNLAVVDVLGNANMVVTYRSQVAYNM